MIIDTLIEAINNPLYPTVIRQTLQVIADHDLPALAPGKYEIRGDRIYFSVIDAESFPFEKQRPEYHRQYIDIHIVLAGEEIIGAGVRGLPQEAIDPFDEKNDIGFCQRIESETLIHLQPGELAVIFTHELHRPMCTLGTPAPLRKIVVKVDHALLNQ